MRTLLIIASLLLNACANDTRPPLVATDLRITAPVPGQKMSAGYLSLTNNTREAMNITEVTSPDFGSVEIHESILQDGIAKMRRISSLTIPASSTVKLNPGGKHLMLMRPSANIEQVSLSFYDGNTLLLDVQTSITARDN